MLKIFLWGNVGNIENIFVPLQRIFKQNHKNHPKE